MERQYRFKVRDAINKLYGNRRCEVGMGRAARSKRYLRYHLVMPPTTHNKHMDAANHETYRDIVSRKVRWAVFCFFAPEMVTILSGLQWESARNSIQLMSSLNAGV